MGGRDKDGGMEEIWDEKTEERKKNRVKKEWNVEDSRERKGQRNRQYGVWERKK